MTSSKEIPHLPIKLHGQSNFTTWRTLITSYLRHYGAQDVVFGTIPRPPPTPPNGGSTAARGQFTQRAINREVWDRLDTFSIVLIHTNVEPHIVPITTRYTHAHEMWAALCRTFEGRDFVTLHALLKTVLTLTYNDTEPLVDHLGEFERLWSMLIERTLGADSTSSWAGSVLAWALNKLANNDEAKKTFLLMTLPPSYGEFVNDMLANEKMGFKDVYQCLAEASV
ncbi:uncharacterized protein H6S33_008611 [Morchella sextelata]|jgi:hypothetical protein|uniref:uncharacterized protein n=1 Tax=Morchella sextelata TaxID=1174677 RepID=UPI001D05616B|nr:uncharacterized protein H6S33_008611 [Morchella sextelata]KAH0602530.1 hypothetical protein H6S33_008611 [Morchella sextelata]